MTNQPYIRINEEPKAYHYPVVPIPDNLDNKYWQTDDFDVEQFDKDWQAHNQWPSSSIEISPELEWKEGDVKELDKDFEIGYQLFSHWADGFWFKTSKDEYERHHPSVKRIVAIPITQMKEL